MPRTHTAVHIEHWDLMHFAWSSQLLNTLWLHDWQIARIAQVSTA